MDTIADPDFIEGCKNALQQQNLNLENYFIPKN